MWGDDRGAKRVLLFAVLSDGELRLVVGEGAEKGTARVPALVEAVRSYSYMDRAVLVGVNVSEGRESTFSVLGYRLGGVEVAREYDPNLPRITAYGGDLRGVSEPGDTGCRVRLPLATNGGGGGAG